MKNEPPHPGHSKARPRQSGPLEPRATRPSGRVGTAAASRADPPPDGAGRDSGAPSLARNPDDGTAAEHKFRALLEAAPDAMIIVDHRGLIELVNAQAVDLFGYSRNEMIGRPIEILVPERLHGLHTAHRAAYAHAPGARLMARRRELSARRKDGTEFAAEISLSPLMTESGPLVISAIRNITERREAEHRLQEAQQFARSTLEALPASLAVLDETGTILSTNQAWLDFRQTDGTFPLSTMTGDNYLDACDEAAGDGVEEAARFGAGIREVLSGARHRFSMEYRCQGPGPQRWLVGYVTAFPGNPPSRVVVAHLDISERKRAEQAIRRLNSELETQVERRTAQVSVTNAELRHQIALRRRLEEEILDISEREQQRIGQDLHDDLGQQLAGIWCLSRVLETNLAARKSPDAKDAAKVTRLLKDALALTRTLARGLHPVAVQAGGLTAALDELRHRTADVFGVHCGCKCSPAPAMDNTTATHLYRIAQEAVTNAAKHSRAREIEIELSSNPHHTILSIKDDGTGMPAPDEKRNGMGLRIMKYRADMIGGTLDIHENQAGGGTIVTCTIPTPRGQPRTPSPHAQEAVQAVQAAQAAQAAQAVSTVQAARTSPKTKGSHRR